MIPSTVGAFIAFLLLVAPGLLSALLRERRRPGRSETAFREASRVALASLTFSAASVAALAIVRAAMPDWMPDVGAWFRDANYLDSHYRLVLRAVVLEVVLACIAAVVWALVRGSSDQGHIDPDTDIWFEVLRRDRPAKTTPWLRVRLPDNTQLFGYLDAYTTDVAPAERELSLRGPGLTLKAASGVDTDLEPRWDRIVVRGDQVTFLMVSYRPSAE